MTSNLLLLQALEQEWAVIMSARWTRRRLRSWSDTDPLFDGYLSLDQILETIRHGDSRASRDLCWALLDKVPNDDLARRAVLQAMMPALTNELMRVLLPARDDPATSFDRADNEVEQILLTAATEAIANYAGSRGAWPMSDLVRRTHRLVIQSLKAERRWRNHNNIAAEDDHTTETPAAIADVEPHPIVELVNVLDAVRATQIISEPEHDLIVATRCVGFRVGELVEVFGATADTLKHRRARAESKVISAMVEMKAAS